MIDPFVTIIRLMDRVYVEWQTAELERLASTRRQATGREGDAGG